MPNDKGQGEGGMKTQILSGIFFCLLALLCLGHMGQLVPMLPQAWFLMFVAASAAVSYWTLGAFLVWDAAKKRREWLATQNRRRPSGNAPTALLRGMRLGK